DAHVFVAVYSIPISRRKRINIDSGAIAIYYVVSTFSRAVNTVRLIVVDGVACDQDTAAADDSGVGVVVDDISTNGGGTVGIDNARKECRQIAVRKDGVSINSTVIAMSVNCTAIRLKCVVGDRKMIEIKAVESIEAVTND